MNITNFIKRTILSAIVSFFAIYGYAQQPISLSPYKDGHPLPDSLKDHSTPVRMSLSSSAAKKSLPVKQKDRLSDENSGNTTDERTKPVAVSAAKKP